ncbi:hypothetical protein DRQ36_06180 [bacterium]|nr:MAG: hypothetical protein DRQ36_06180 [bacterium]
MKKLIAIIVLVTILSFSAFTDIKIAALTLTEPYGVGDFVTALDALISADTTIDLILGPAEALGGDSNKARIIFSDTSGIITLAPADTFTRSREVYNALVAAKTLAERYEITIIPGTLWEVDTNYRCFESAPIIGPDGEIARVRRKAHQYVTDPLVDPGIRLDTVITRDGDIYTYMLSITNESRDLAPLYSAFDDTADILLIATRRWITDFAGVVDVIEAGCPPDWSYISAYFPPSEIEGLVDNGWARPEAPIVIDCFDRVAAADFTANLLPAYRPIDEWFIYRDYIATSDWIIVTCEPDSPLTKSVLKAVIIAHDTLGNPVESVYINYGPAGEIPSRSGWTDEYGIFTFTTCAEDSYYFLLSADSCIIEPEETTIFVGYDAPACTIEVTVMLDTVYYVGESNLPKNVELSAQPNPFNSACRITAPGPVEIYDINGQLVRAIRESPLPNRSTIWNPGKDIGSGIYLLRCTTEAEPMEIKLIYLK